jgi:hypothetical protein
MATLWSPICDQLGIKVPIFGFAHDIATVAAISNAGRLWRVRRNAAVSG